MASQFWFSNPTILFNKEYMFDLFPKSYMYYEEKINAISRLIIIVTILGYILTSSKRVIMVGIATLFGIVILFKIRKQKITKNVLENFDVNGNKNANFVKNKSNSIINPVSLDSFLKTEFKEGDKRNPFSNLLLTQINDDPERKSAPPSFNVDVDVDITKNVKKAVQMMNPGIKNTAKQLFGDIWQQFELDQSNRQFYSTANSRVANDQGAYAQFLYSDLKYSGKESTPEGAIARIQNNYQWINP